MGRSGKKTGKEDNVVVNLSKGGVLKVFDAKGPIASDTGLIGELTNGRVVVSHLVQKDNEISGSLNGSEGGEWHLKGSFCYRRKNQMNAWKSILSPKRLLVSLDRLVGFMQT